MSSDGTWYYAQNNNKYGPINSVQLKALVENGQLQKTDLVWKEGMDDWKPAGKVAGLFAQEAVAAAPVAATPPSVDPQGNQLGGSVGIVPDPKRPSRISARNNPFDFMEVLKPIGSIILLAGLVLVIFSRGCDSINSRGLVSLRATVEELGQPADDEDADDRENRMEDMTKAAKTLEQRRTLNQKMGYWLEVLFVLGTVCFSLGLLVSGFTSDSAGRWISLVMLAIIVFSIYIGGIAWIASLSGMMPGF